ncbi:hypothetical protein GCM10028789_01150 [Sinomonas halotolerans]
MPTRGAAVELRQWGNHLRHGTVEAVLPDGSGFWIAAEGAAPRVFVHRGYEDIEVWINDPTSRSRRRVG